jgi:imidazoleglycerol phosphate synthase glutamine amidotransferase subunit HisH
MTAKLAQWFGCGDFRSWVNALVSAYNNTGNFQSAAATANGLLGLDVGMQLVQISEATAGVVAFCAVFTPELFSLVVNTAKAGWNKLGSVRKGCQTEAVCGRIATEEASVCKKTNGCIR